MARSLRDMGASTFSSLRIRNYRLYYVGQAISTSGTFMQSIAQAWLVLQLTHSGTALGIVAALQNLPVLLLAPWGGVVADRFPKRTLLLMTQSAFGIVALVFGGFVITGLVRLWMVYVLALIFGLINCIDNPTRQSFVVEMVGKEELKNAVTLYSSMVNLARVVGPALAALLISVLGLGPCFVANGLSYAAVLVMLLAMNTQELHPAVPLAHAAGQITAGFRYVYNTPILRNVLVIMAIIGTLTYEFQVSLPLLAQFTFHGNASSYAALTAALGLGAVVGGLVTASRRFDLHRSSRGGSFLLWGLCTAGGSDAHSPPGCGGCSPGWLLFYPFFLLREHNAAVSERPADARPGHGLVGDRVPRLDHDRRADRRFHRRTCQPALGPCHRGAGRDRGGGLRGRHAPRGRTQQGL